MRHLSVHVFVVNQIHKSSILKTSITNEIMSYSRSAYRKLILPDMVPLQKICFHGRGKKSAGKLLTTSYAENLIFLVNIHSIKPRSLREHYKKSSLTGRR